MYEITIKLVVYPSKKEPPSNDLVLHLVNEALNSYHFTETLPLGTIVIESIVDKTKEMPF